MVWRLLCTKEKKIQRPWASFECWHVSARILRCCKKEMRKKIIALLEVFQEKTEKKEEEKGGKNTQA